MLTQPSQGSACNAQFRRDVLLTCYEALAREGFDRYRKYAVDWVVKDDFHCWVGLNSGLYSSYVEVSPFVGIHAVQIMKLYTELESKRYDRAVATYAVHLGELVPNETAFRFSKGTNVASESERLAKLCRIVGLPLAGTISDYANLLPLLRKRVEMLGGYPERVASCLYLMGRFDDARSFVERLKLQEPCYFEKFANAFIAMLDEQSEVN